MNLRREKSLNHKKTNTVTNFCKTFLHVDMDAFFASVEQHDHPEFLGKPVVVGSPPDRRGVVAAASYEARAFGIHSAMPSRTAHQKCPEAVFLPVNMPRYKEVSREIMRIFESYTPLVQPLSIDEAFLDITGSQHLFGSGEAIAQKIRADIFKSTGLTASVGIAPNLFLAKLASDMNKPDGLTQVPFEQSAIETFLAPLPIKRMWGVGKVTQQKLLQAGITTFQHVRECPPDRLERLVGVRAAEVFLRLSHGIDFRKIETDTEEKSISNEHTFDTNTTDAEAIRHIFLHLIDKVGARLRKASRFATTVHIKLRWEDFSTTTRQHKLAIACRDDITLREEGLALLHTYLLKRPVRLIGFGVSGLSETPRHSGQLDLFEPPNKTGHDKRERLSQATDTIKRKYGNPSIRRGSEI